MKGDRIFIVEIGDFLVSSDIITEFFSCDYEKCKGCCCIIGDSGAPLKDGEEGELRDNFAGYKEFMTPEGMAAINNQGFAIRDYDGDLVTPLVNNEECAYTCFDAKGNCFCAIERSFSQGKCTFRKPESCTLYPIRVSKLSNGKTALNLHRWKICADAYRKGKKEGIPVYIFLREHLIHYFGEEFYSMLEAAAKSLSASL